MLNLAMLLEDSAREVPERIAIVCEGTRLSYAELQAAANQVANGLVQAGISKGAKVALSCQDVPSFVIAYYGILQAVAVGLPLNILLKTPEIAYHLTDGDATAYFCQEGMPELPIGQLGYAAFQEVESCQHFFLITNTPDAPSSIPGATTLGMLMADQPTTFETVATSPDDTAVILYTTRPTGEPKGAELTHLHILLNARLPDMMSPQPHHHFHLLTLPLFHP